VAQLLQDNVLIIDQMRGNVVSVQLEENQALMEGFYRNTKSVFSLLSALPCVLPPLPPQCRINDAFLSHMHIVGTAAAAAAATAASGVGAGVTYGQQAGIVFPHHPTSLSNTASAAAAAAATATAAAATTTATGSVRPPPLSTTLPSGASLPPSGIEGLPAASPANSVFALTLNHPAGP
jgi:hypothetical protein